MDLFIPKETLDILFYCIDGFNLYQGKEEHEYV